MYVGAGLAPPAKAVFVVRGLRPPNEVGSMNL